MWKTARGTLRTAKLLPDYPVRMSAAWGWFLAALERARFQIDWRGSASWDARHDNIIARVCSPSRPNRLGVRGKICIGLKERQVADEALC